MSELIEIKVKCGKCLKVSSIRDATFDVQGAYQCGSCENSYGDTCMCERGSATLEFRCTHCKYYEEIYL